MIKSAPELDSPPEFFDLFFFKNELWDAGKAKIVSTKIYPGPITFANSEYITAAFNPYKKDGARLQIIDKGLNIKHDIKIPGYLSWDRRYCLEIFEGDLWRSDINPETGTLENKKKVTDLGIFRYGLECQAWVGDLIVFTEGVGKPQFILNTASGELKYFSSDGTDQGVKFVMRHPTGQIVPPNTVFSPALLRCFTGIEGDYSSSSYIYDFNGQLGYGPYQGGTWLSTRFYVTTVQLPSEDPSNLIGPTAYVAVDLQEGKSEQICSGCEPTIWSPNQRYGIEVTHYNRDNFSYIWDFLEGKKLEWPANAGKLFMNGNGQYLNPIAWLSNTKIMYVQSGDLVTQGTYIYDLENGTNKRVSSKKAIEIINLPGSNYGAFVIDNQPFRIDLRDLSITELNSTTEQLDGGRMLNKFSFYLNHVGPVDIRFPRRYR